MPRKRKDLSQETECAVLAASRRRCCICFGLNRDITLKKGQIAHLDRNAQNAKLDNLSFMCLEHHDEYDSRTSQAKGFTLGEVRRFRDELYVAVDRALNESVKFGTLEIYPDDIVEGRFVRRGERDIAELQVRHVAPSRVQVSGLALWGTDRELPSNGEVEFEVDLLPGNTAEFTEFVEGEGLYRLRLTFLANALVAHEQRLVGYFGHNVTFEGVYLRQPAA
jgi:hypothetical protein